VRSCTGGWVGRLELSFPAPADAAARFEAPDPKLPISDLPPNNGLQLTWRSLRSHHAAEPDTLGSRNSTWRIGVPSLCMLRLRQVTSGGPDRWRAWLSAAALAASTVALAAVVLVPWGCSPSVSGNARVVRMAVQSWQAVVTSSSCPTYPDLVRAGLLDPGVSRVDGTDFQIACSSDDVTVVWAGPDRLLRTLDDETAPSPLAPAEPLMIARLGLALLVPCLLAVIFSILAIVATFCRLSTASLLCRLAGIAGCLVLVVCFCCGLLDRHVSHVASTRAGLSLADAERARGRGNQNFLFEAALGAATGVPGAILLPIRLRRRPRRSPNH
jgi:hypothetical protein